MDFSRSVGGSGSSRHLNAARGTDFTAQFFPTSSQPISIRSNGQASADGADAAIGVLVLEPASYAGSVSGRSQRLRDESALSSSVQPEGGKQDDRYGLADIAQPGATDTGVFSYIGSLRRAFSGTPVNTGLASPPPPGKPPNRQVGFVLPNPSGGASSVAATGTGSGHATKPSVSTTPTPKASPPQPSRSVAHQRTPSVTSQQSLDAYGSNGGAPLSGAGTSTETPSGTRIVTLGASVPQFSSMSTSGYHKAPPPSATAAISQSQAGGTAAQSHNSVASALPHSRSTSAAQFISELFAPTSTGVGGVTVTPASASAVPVDNGPGTLNTSSQGVPAHTSSAVHVAGSTSTLAPGTVSSGHAHAPAGSVASSAAPASSAVFNAGTASSTTANLASVTAPPRSGVPEAVLNGWDLQLCVDKPDSSELFCARCHRVARDAVGPRSVCHHTFCQACATEWCSHSAVCPVDARSLSAQNFVVLPDLRLRVGALRYRCEKIGCGEAVPIADLDAHAREDCRARTIVCPICNERILAIKMQQHMKDSVEDHLENALRECANYRATIMVHEEAIDRLKEANAAQEREIQEQRETNRRLQRMWQNLDEVYAKEVQLNRQQRAQLNEYAAQLALLTARGNFPWLASFSTAVGADLSKSVSDMHLSSAAAGAAPAQSAVLRTPQHVNVKLRSSQAQHHSRSASVAIGLRDTVADADTDGMTTGQSFSFVSPPRTAGRHVSNGSNGLSHKARAQLHFDSDTAEAEAGRDPTRSPSQNSDVEPDGLARSQSGALPFMLAVPGSSLPASTHLVYSAFQSLRSPPSTNAKAGARHQLRSRHSESTGDDTVSEDAATVDHQSVNGGADRTSSHDADDCSASDVKSPHASTAQQHGELFQWDRSRQHKLIVLSPDGLTAVNHIGVAAKVRRDSVLRLTHRVSVEICSLLCCCRFNPSSLLPVQ